MSDSLVDIIRRVLHLERRVNRLESLETPTIGGGGGVPGAPNDAQYVTLALDAGLTSERVLTEGADIDLVDTGANGTITVGRGGDKILLFDSGGTPVAEYAATDAGLTAALAAAGAGDVVELPAIAIAGGPWTVPANVTLKGQGRMTSTLTGNLTVNGHLETSYVVGNTTIGATGDASDCNLYASAGAVVTSTGGTCHFCRIGGLVAATYAYYTDGDNGARYGLFNCSLECQVGIVVYAHDVYFEMDNCIVWSFAGVAARIQNAHHVSNCKLYSNGTDALQHSAGSFWLTNTSLHSVAGFGCNNTIAGIYVCDCQLGSVNDVTLLTFLFGDRSSWDTIVAGGPANHARDVWANTHTIHLPEPTGLVADAGKAALLNAAGTQYVLGAVVLPSGAHYNILYSEHNVTNPPSYNDIVGAFGVPDIGTLGILNDNALDLNVYLCGATVTGWWYVNLVKSAMLAFTALSVISLDLYTDVAGTHLNVHTPDTGGMWTENSGSWTVQADNSIRNATAGGAIYTATVDAGKANLQARVLMGTVAAAGNHVALLIFRYTNDLNYWGAGYDTAAGLFVIGKLVAGVWTTVTSKAWTGQYQIWQTVEITANGNNISAIFDGGYGLSTVDAFNNTATKVGIAEYRDGGYLANGFDDFQIVDLPTYAWTRTGTVVDETEAWESGGTLEPSVILDDDPKILTTYAQVFKMWYSANWGVSPGVGYAESADGVTWTKYSGNPIATAPRHSSVMKVGGVFYMYGSDNTVSRTRINLWTSTDGINWTLDTTACISVGGGGTWDDAILGNTFVWRESATAWYMLYDATDTLVAGVNMIFRLGLATSTDGRTWAKSLANPVIDYKSQMAGSPWCMKGDDGYYYLFGHGTSYGFAPTFIQRWRSSNLTTWTRLPLMTIIPRIGATEGEDTLNGQTADPFIIEHNGTAYMYFTGVQDAYTGGSRIVLATADARAIRGY